MNGDLKCHVDDLKRRGDLGFWNTANDNLKRRNGELKRRDRRSEASRRSGLLKRRKRRSKAPRRRAQASRWELKRHDDELKHRDGDLGFLHFKNHLREYVRERENKVGKVRKKNGAECF